MHVLRSKGLKYLLSDSSWGAVYNTDARAPTQATVVQESLKS